MPGDRQHRPGINGPGEQRHRGQQVAVRLGQSVRVELEHLADPRIRKGRLAEFGAQRGQVVGREMIREQSGEHACGQGMPIHRPD